MPLRSFGLFASLLVPTDFLLTIIIQPLLYYIYEVLILKKKINKVGDVNVSSPVGSEEGELRRELEQEEEKESDGAGGVEMDLYLPR